MFFEDYYLDDPKFDEKTARAKNVTFEAAIRVRVKLVNKRSGEIKEQEVYLGDFPLVKRMIKASGDFHFSIKKV